MSPDAQRIAIAEACGWTECGVRHPSMGGKGEPCGHRQGTPRGCWAPLPNYLTDLNAMHEAVGSLSGDKVILFCEQLATVTGASAHSIRAYQTRLLVMATAAQRAEAFLRTIRKWEELP